MTTEPLCTVNRRCLFLESFASLSHLELFKSLEELFPKWSWTLHTLPDRQWKWRNRVGALQFSQTIARNTKYDLLITGSLLNLAELVALRPDLSTAFKVAYFHENQFVYPYRTQISDSDKQIMYTSITTALCADAVLFNSQFNLETFCDGARSFLAKLPVDLDSHQVITEIQSKATVFPIPILAEVTTNTPRNSPPIILWNHRWEHDKQPELFFSALERLKEKGVPFGLIVAGESFDVNPEVFEKAETDFADEIISFGFVENRAEYEKLLARADIVVSSAAQEFYGISVLEAIANGAVPVVPDALSYRELIPESYRIPPNSVESLAKKLSALLNLGAEGLPARAEIAEIARPYLLSENTMLWRERFLRLIN